MNVKRCFILSLLLLLLQACTPAPPSHTEDICKIFKEYPNWYWSARKSEKKWHVPIGVQLAIIHQESSFNAKAKPGRTKIVWVIPWTRPSSSYGYSQALKKTWKRYQRSSGNNGDRDKFSAATDFIGWYGQQAHKRAGIQKNDAYNLYLAYHEGIGGYKRKTYKNKQWLINVSKRVDARARLYERQLAGCRNSIKKPWWKI